MLAHDWRSTGTDHERQRQCCERFTRASIPGHPARCSPSTPSPAARMPIAFLPPEEQPRTPPMASQWRAHRPRHRQSQPAKAAPHLRPVRTRATTEQRGSMRRPTPLPSHPAHPQRLSPWVAPRSAFPKPAAPPQRLTTRRPIATQQPLRPNHTEPQPFIGRHRFISDPRLHNHPRHIRGGDNHIR